MMSQWNRVSELHNSAIGTHQGLSVAAIVSYLISFIGWKIQELTTFLRRHFREFQCLVTGF
jgi:hypothetical protein